MSGGIVAQYGFLFQRSTFVLFFLKKMSMDCFFTYEGKDDLDVEKNDSIYAVSIPEKEYIQVKSGYLSKNCFAKVIGNWILMESKLENSKFTLFLENDLDFEKCADETITSIINYFIEGKKKKKNAIARKVYDKYVSILESTVFRDKIIKFINESTIVIKSHDEILEEINEIYHNNYCKDIIIYNLAKRKRVERFLSYVNAEIDAALLAKKPYVLNFGKFMGIILKVSDEITDNKYKIDISAFKKKELNKAINIVNERKAREVKQLYLVDNDINFAVQGILSELLYKDFRDIYYDKETIDILNIEQNAKENFNQVVLELGANCLPKELYFKTIKEDISGELLPSGPIYRNGCYIFLTSDKASEENQISWGDTSE